jgi:hypothetical protein
MHARSTGATAPGCWRNRRRIGMVIDVTIMGHDGRQLLAA